MRAAISLACAVVSGGLVGCPDGDCSDRIAPKLMCDAKLSCDVGREVTLNEGGGERSRMGVGTIGLGSERSWIPSYAFEVEYERPLGFVRVGEDFGGIGETGLGGFSVTMASTGRVWLRLGCTSGPGERPRSVRAFSASSGLARVFERPAETLAASRARRSFRLGLAWPCEAGAVSFSGSCGVSIASGDLMFSLLSSFFSRSDSFSLGSSGEGRCRGDRSISKGGRVGGDRAEISMRGLGGMRIRDTLVAAVAVDVPLPVRRWPSTLLASGASSESESLSDEDVESLSLSTVFFCGFARATPV